MPDRQIRPASPRFDGVDLLRGLSILAVILLHINIHMSGSGFAPRRLLARSVYHLLFTNGDKGVTIFFAISGFLITFTTLRRFGSLSKMRPAVFYRIRFARIAPLLLALLVLLSLLHLGHVRDFRISPKVATLPRALFAALTFHINWLEASAHAYLPANWDVLWSLSVEEMFYLFFPIVCVLLLRRRLTRPLFFGLLMALIIAGPFPRSVRNPNPIWADSSYLGGMDAIALGCLCALATNRLFAGRRLASASFRQGLLALEIAGAALMFWIALWPPLAWMRSIGRAGLDGSLLALATCFIMAATVLRGGVGTRSTAPLRWMGRHSYEIYLTHSFFVIGATELYRHLRGVPAKADLPASTPWIAVPSVAALAVWCAAVVLLSVALAALIARYFTEPANRLLRGAAAPTHRSPSQHDHALATQ